MTPVPHPHRVDRGYSLGTLFLLTAACAAVLALVTPLLRSAVSDEIGLSEFAISIMAGGALLGVIGLIVGFFHFSRLKGTLLGLLLGITLGTFSGPLIFLPPEDFSMLFALAAGGVALLLGLAVAIRLGSDGWRKAGLRVEPQHRSEPKRHPLDPDAEDET